jgi:RHS repeat-associated protein
VTTVYLAGGWEQDVQSGVSTKTRAFMTLQGRGIAQRERIASPASDTTIYLHGDHLGGVSAATSSTGAVLSRQAFTPWGELRAGGGDVTQTTRDFTGQKKDDTGLLFYNARYYDPKLGRFASADSIVPGSASGRDDAR